MKNKILLVGLLVSILGFSFIERSFADEDLSNCDDLDYYNLTRHGKAVLRENRHTRALNEQIIRWANYFIEVAEQQMKYSDIIINSQRHGVVITQVQMLRALNQLTLTLYGVSKFDKMKPDISEYLERKTKIMDLIHDGKLKKARDEASELRKKPKKVIFNLNLTEGFSLIGITKWDEPRNCD